MSRLIFIGIKHLQQTDIHTPGRVRTHNLSRPTPSTARQLGPAAFTVYCHFYFIINHDMKQN